MKMKRSCCSLAESCRGRDYLAANSLTHLFGSFNMKNDDSLILILCRRVKPNYLARFELVFCLDHTKLA